MNFVSYLLAVSQGQLTAVIVLAVLVVLVWLAVGLTFIFKKSVRSAAQSSESVVQTYTDKQEHVQMSASSAAASRSAPPKDRHIFIHHVYDDEQQPAQAQAPMQMQNPMMQAPMQMPFMPMAVPFPMQNPMQMPTDQDSALSEASNDEDDDNESEIIMVDNKPVRVLYRKSFLARLIQSSPETKGWYVELANEVMAYKLKPRISWNYAAFHVGKGQFCRFNVKNKTLCMYFAIDFNEVKDKYHVEHSQTKRFEKTPTMMRITTDKTLHEAVELIELLAKRNDLKRGTSVTTERVSKYPYETRESLISRNLIKYNIVAGDVSDVELAEDIERLRAEVKSQIRQSITAEEAHTILSDEAARKLIIVENIKEDDRSKRTAKRLIVNIDTISKNFNANDKVTLQILKDKKLVPRNEKAIKIAARGTLNKPLTIYAEDFAADAVKMIVLTGGQAIKC